MSQRSKHNTIYIWIGLILLVAALLRLALLTDLPPGMTHDEADHGLDAWGVVNGIRPIYFPTASGREPFFDYISAIFMSFLGPTILAGHLTAAFSSLILIAATFTWVKLAFDRRIALLTAAGLSVNFWTLMTARHALRSVTMPMLLVLAAAVFWLGLNKTKANGTQLGQRPFTVYPLLSGLLLGASFYTYMPARITWALFPALLVVWLILDRDQLRRSWRQVLLTIGVAGLVGLPLFWHLATTEAEARIGQLTGPIDAIRDEGDFRPILNNISDALRIITVEGDAWTWRYNIPGRPMLTPAMGLLFYVGILLAFWYLIKRPEWRTPLLFALMWLVAGWLPALITGSDASTTRAIGMQPVLFLFPALALNALWRYSYNCNPCKTTFAARYAPLLSILLFVTIGIDTARSYFVVWGNHPDVRVHYETTRVTAIDYLNRAGSGAVAISSPRPDRFHDPSTALMALTNPAVSLRWYNGAHSLLLPNSSDGMIVFSGWAAPDGSLARYLDGLTPIEQIEMRADDLDRPITIYQVNTAELAQSLLKTQFTQLDPVQFGENVTLLGYQLSELEDQIEVNTIWQIDRPIDGLKLFTHLLSSPDQPPLAQADRLDVPSFYWQAGDYFIQRHQFTRPDLPAGSYPISIGAYIEPAPTQFLRLTTNLGTDHVILTQLERPE
ncbi:MAG: glycosyltransferase family 39 protein [Candidatus Promineifilaceae bacterium]